ncbi:MAG: hypothetical protein VKO64_09390 [Candidatus Sericytochromatia bacterium]|nr:hypothetical protein [Candidatus Sericytochromatia bacterium]
MTRLVAEKYPTAAFYRIDEEVRELHQSYIAHLGNRDVAFDAIPVSPEDPGEDEPVPEREPAAVAAEPEVEGSSGARQAPEEIEVARIEAELENLPYPGDKPNAPRLLLSRLRLRHFVVTGLRFLSLAILTVVLSWRLVPAAPPWWVVGLGGCVVGFLGVLVAQLLTRIEEAWQARRAEPSLVRLGLGQSVAVIVLVVEEWENLQGQVRGSVPPTDEERRSAFYSAWSRRQGGPVFLGLGSVAAFAMVVLISVSVVYRWQASFGMGQNDIQAFFLHLVVAMGVLALCALPHPYLLAIPEIPVMGRTVDALRKQWRAELSDWSDRVRALDKERRALMATREAAFARLIVVRKKEVDKKKQLHQKEKQGAVKKKSKDSAIDKEQRSARLREWEEIRFRLYSELKRRLEDWETNRHFKAGEWAELVKWQKNIDSRGIFLRIANLIAILGLTYPASLVLVGLLPFLGKIRLFYGGVRFVVSPGAWTAWLILILLAEWAVVEAIPSIVMNYERNGFLRNGYSGVVDRMAARRYEVLDRAELLTRLRGPVILSVVGTLIILLEFASNYSYIQANTVSNGDILPVVLPAIFTLGFLVVCVVKGMDRLNQEWLIRCVGRRRWESSTWEDDRLQGQPAIDSGPEVVRPTFRKRPPLGNGTAARPVEDAKG